MNYIGEHLLPGKIGHFLTILSLVASLLATISFFFSNYKQELIEKKQWLQIGRIAFLVETICVIGTFGVLYFIISNHYHEYFYAWNHSSRSLPLKYILSCFWEGSEGSFLLWSFWHCVLGWILISKSKKWEAPVMTAISFAQFCLASMVIGIFIFGEKIGSNPFLLWRYQMPELPLFTNPNYLDSPRVFEGNDLNVLLQNYWMVIHPPILFLGFASTIVPFAFAYAGLINKDHSWVNISLPWAVFSGAILGTGIMMGAAWAYESLSFGGYWAWDPVENASLVPWITLISGIHTNLIFKKTNYSLRSTYFFYIISFCLVLYSTFLTRSGILGDTSVHAFTDLGMNVQLLVFLLIFVIPIFTLFGIRYKNIPTVSKEENTYSREFWMFIGSLVLFLSSIIIITNTSVPIYNKLFNANIAPPENREYAYNRIQVFVVIIIGILTAITQYLKYKDTPLPYFLKKIWIPTILTFLVSGSISLWGNINYDKQGLGFLIAIHLALFASVYTLIANASYIWLVLNGKWKVAGSSVAHIGFGLILLGILISSSKKTVLSQNTTGIAVFNKNKTEDPAENITLFKGMPTDMGKYMVTYVNDTNNSEERKRFFQIDFLSKDKKDHFVVYPDLAKNNKGNQGFAANPSSKHYWNKDIFVYISAFQENTKDDTTTFRSREMKVGDTIYYSNGFIILNSINVSPPNLQSRYSPADTALMLDISVVAKDGRRYTCNPGIALQSGTMKMLPDTVVAQSIVLNFNKFIDPQTGKLQLGIKESSMITDLITLKVYEFPMINVLWLGVIVMVIGMALSIYQRIQIKTLAKV